MKLPYEEPYFDIFGILSTDAITASLTGDWDNEWDGKLEPED